MIATISDIYQGDIVMNKIVIYKKNGIWYTTPEDNYNAIVQNARLIHRMDGFTNPQEIIEYYCKYFGSTTANFIIIPDL